jgi:hypothetical protein
LTNDVETCSDCRGLGFRAGCAATNKFGHKVSP